jgi:OFA family oxalate/formate antiporter-like MFS transporter
MNSPTSPLSASSPAARAPGAPAADQSNAVPATRWIQLLLGFIVMMTISSPQYVWTLFTTDFMSTTGSKLSQVQWTITLLIVLQTWLAPVQGYLIERFGPRRLIGLGAVLSGLGWIASAQISTLTGLYLTYGLLCGLGTGVVYVGIIGLMVQWFPDRRGFATGVVAAGYGFGAIFSTFPIDAMMKLSGYEHTLTIFGAIFAVVGLAAALALRKPGGGTQPDVAANRAALPASRSGSGKTINYSPTQMLRSPIFWLMFVMYSMMSTGGLMVITQFKSFAQSFGIDGKTLISIFGMSMAAIPAALTFDRVTNGLTRPFFGWVSDRIGRENTMGIAFILEGCAIALLLANRTDPWMLVVLSGLVFFGWGEIFSLFPATLTDTFGPAHATTNYGFLYMAQGVGSILGAPVAAMIFEASGSWLPVFYTIIGLDILTGLLALFVLKGMRQRFLANS